jgi:hypothetical protein
MQAVVTQITPHEAHFALVRAGKVVTAWRVTSRTQISVSHDLTPALVHGDLLASVNVSRGTRSEHVVLQLSPTGARAPISLDAKVVFGDAGAVAVTALRIGSDGRLYQLRTSPKTGLTIASYSLGR